MLKPWPLRIFCISLTVAFYLDYHLYVSFPPQDSSEALSCFSLFCDSVHLRRSSTGLFLSLLICIPSGLWGPLVDRARVAARLLLISRLISPALEISSCRAAWTAVGTLGGVMWCLTRSCEPSGSASLRGIRLMVTVVTPFTGANETEVWNG